MFGPSPTFPGGPGGSPAGAGGGSSGFSGRDIIWVDLRFPSGIGNNGTEDLPFSTANLGLGALPDGGTLIMVGGDASTEPGVSIAARSFAIRGFGGQMASGGLTPKLPTLTYAITTGTQRLAFHNVSVALVHAGASASLTQFHFEFCPTVTLTGGTDAPPVYWVGDGTCTFSGAGGPAEFHGGTIDGYTANSGAVVLDGCNVTGNIESPTSVTILGGCSFTAISITSPSIKIDAASYYRAVAAGVSFSSSAVVLIATAAPVDIGTANAAGSAKTYSLSDHVHDLPFTPVQQALAAASAAVSVNSQRVTDLGTPTNPNDAVRLVDLTAAAAGLKVKTSALVVATTNQATMTGQAQTIDGVALTTVGMRVLLIAQTTATQNGLWLVQSGAWIRPVDGSIPANDFSAGSSAAQSYVLITSGTANAGNSYFCTNAAGSDVVDTNNLNWTIFNQPPVLVAGTGLVKTGSTLDVVANADGSIVANSNDIQVGVLATDAQHGVRGGGTQHANATTSVAGFMSAADKTKIDGITGDGVERVGKAPCRAATTANITLSGTQTVDGVSLIAGNRCLVKNQSTGSQNGIYDVASGAWTRSTDADGAGDLVGGTLVPISEGTVNGNQVAMLTTDDPITIGSTALTFAMGRVAAIGASAPQDVTKAAAAVGTSTLAAPLDHKHDVSTAVVIDIGTAANAEGTATSLARSDHAHRITFTVVAAVLAAASAAISVNSQKITNLATPTVATDAATKGYADGLFVPAGGTGQLQYNNGGVFDGASGITVVGSETALAFGGTAVASGALRFPNATDVVVARNALGNGDLVLLRVDSVDKVFLGNNDVANAVISVATGGGLTVRVANTPEFAFDATALTMNNNNLVMGTGFVSFSATPATGGAVRLGNNYQVTSAKTTGGSFHLISMAADNTIYVGDQNVSELNLEIGTNLDFDFSGGTNPEYRFTSTAAVFGDSNVLVFGSSLTSGSGLIRTTTSPGAVLGSRNYDNTGNQSVITVSGDGTTFNDVVLGDSSAKGHNSIYLSAKAQAVVSLAAGVHTYVFGTAALDVVNHYVAIGGSNYPSAGTALRLSNGLTAVVRNAANTQNIQVFNFGASDELSIWDQVQGGNVNYDVPTTKIHKFRIAGASEYEFSATALDMKGNNLLMGAGFASFGTNPAGAGAIRLPNNFSSISMKNVANSGNLSLLAASSDDIYVGDLAATTTYVQSGAAVTLAPGAAGGLYIFNDGNADFRDNDLKIGGFSPAAGGTIRLNNTNTVYFRNATGSGDVLALNVTASDHVAIGDSTSCEGIDYTVKTAGSHTFKNSGTTRLAVSNTAVLVNGVPLNLSSSSLNGAAYVECLQSGTPSNPGSTGWRTYVDGSGNLVARNNAGTVRTLAVP